MANKAFRAIVCSCAILFISTLWMEVPAQTAKNVEFGAPTGEQFRYAIEHLPELSVDERNALIAKIPKIFPVFVFIPGIMGSKLTKIENGKEKVIFGEFDSLHPDDSNLMFNKPSEEITAALLEEYVVDLYIKKKSTPIYQAAIQTIKTMSAQYGVDVMVYPYDWRQSNVDTAKIFSKWLCKWKSKLEGRPVVFLAHSMGGLVLKYWLSTDYDRFSCDGDNNVVSKWLKVQRVAFLGTPHFGAPQAFFAFTANYYLLYDPIGAKKDTGWYSRIVNYTKEKLDKYYLSKSLNAYGATFPSGYQLLPITMSSCFSSSSPPPILITRIDPDQTLDIFDQESWISYGWPRNLDSSIPRRSFLSDRLRDNLEKAKAFLCDVAKYDIDADQRFKVFRYFGNKKDTICNVTIKQSGRRDREWTVNPEPCSEKGDGTVPAWVASEARRGKLDNNTHSVDKEHVYLAEADGFIADLRLYFDDFHRELQNEFASKQAGVTAAEASPTTVNLYSGMRRLIPSEYDQPQDSGVTAEANRQIASRLELSPRDVYRAAKRKRATTRALGFRVYADVAITKEGKLADQVGADRTNAWALNNAAHIYLQKKDFGRAYVFATRAIAAADALKTPEGRQIRAKAALTAGIAAQKRKDAAAERTHLAIAVGNGNRKAPRFLNR